MLFALIYILLRFFYPVVCVPTDDFIVPKDTFILPSRALLSVGTQTTGGLFFNFSFLSHIFRRPCLHRRLSRLDRRFFTPPTLCRVACGHRQRKDAPKLENYLTLPFLALGNSLKIR